MQGTGNLRRYRFFGYGQQRGDFPVAHVFLPVEEENLSPGFGQSCSQFYDVFFQHGRFYLLFDVRMAFPGGRGSGRCR